MFETEILIGHRLAAGGVATSIVNRNSRLVDEILSGKTFLWKIICSWTQCGKKRFVFV